MRDSIFICYSQKNKPLLEEVLEMLNGLNHQIDVPIQSWSDQAIKGGERWKQEIQTAINRTKVAILLISRPMLASEFIKKEELPQFYKLEKAKQITIIPLYIQKCTAPEAMNAFQAPAPNGPENPWNTLTEPEQDDTLANLGERIVAIFKEVGKR